MLLDIREFWFPKAGNCPEEYEDAFACDSRAGRFAIADGATESSFAGLWARDMVEAYVTTPPPGSAWGLRRWLEPLQGRWHAAIDWGQLPWYAEVKAQAGAFASLLGVELDPAGRWHALAVGDSCLFHVRGQDLVRAFPLERAEEFGNSPLLLSSNPASNHPRVWREVRTLAGDGRPGDLFLLATDALAHWLLSRSEAGERPWEMLRETEGQGEFEGLVMRLRQTGQIHNDDTTLLLVHLLPAASGGEEAQSLP